MTKCLRTKPENGIFHIHLRGNNKKCIFLRDSEFRYFKKILKRYKVRYKYYLYHYILMKNHVHLSLKASEKTDISKLMQGVALSYNHYQRKRRHFVGHLWQGRFKSHIVADDNYLLTLGLYIEKNPVKAGIAENPMDYRWSSYRYYALGEKDPLVDPNPLYETLGKTAKERQSAYQDMMEARIMEEKERK